MDTDDTRFLGLLTSSHEGDSTEELQQIIQEYEGRNCVRAFFEDLILGDVRAIPYMAAKEVLSKR